MRAMTEQSPAMASIRVPIELLREWTLVAVQSRDCSLLGRALTLASAAGHSLQVGHTAAQYTKLPITTYCGYWKWFRRYNPRYHPRAQRACLSNGGRNDLFLQYPWA